MEQVLMKILVVDDDPVSLQLTAMVLEHMGAEVETAVSGHKALELEASWDLVLMDCGMPGLDGYQTTRALREGGYRRPVLALTSDTREKALARCLEAGMNGHVRKPVEPDLLETALTLHLKDPLARARKMAERTGNPKLFVQLITTFSNATQNLMADLETAYGSRDAKMAASVLHRLKGSAGTFGAEELAEQAVLGEQQLAQGLEAADATLRYILDEWPRLRARLQKSAAEEGGTAAAEVGRLLP